MISSNQLLNRLKKYNLLNELFQSIINFEIFPQIKCIEVLENESSLRIEFFKGNGSLTISVDDNDYSILKEDGWGWNYNIKLEKVILELMKL